MEVAHNHAQLCRELASARPLLEAVLAGNFGEVVRALADEEQRERGAGRVYWQPLRQELERLRHAALSKQPPSP
jgi:hypothetical protein